MLSWKDQERTKAQIAEISPVDAEPYDDYVDKRERMAAIVQRWFLRFPPTLGELVDDARAHGDEDALERLLFGSVSRLLDEHFESPQIKGWLVGAWDAGDPDEPGSLLSSIYPTISAFTSDENVGIVGGGMGGITQAMARACTAAGVEIHTSAEVAGILVENDAAVGIELESGERIHARAVISNADPKHTFLKLTPAAALPVDFRKQVEELTTRAAYFKEHSTQSTARSRLLPTSAGYGPTAIAAL